ncbi:MAG TPA: signal peptidase I [Candidatus Saccharimonadales bacterium]|nr:signal peptidase I [Candidatus Saccharimonadales bacterium]
MQDNDVSTSPVNSFPHQAPTQTLNFSYEKASFLERLAASIIDGLIIIAVVLILYITLKSQVSELETLASVFSLIFNSLFIWKKGATPGKMLMKIKVVNTLYQPVSLWQVILRESLGKGLSGLLFNLGYFWVLVDKKKQAWHDKIANTFVVKLTNEGNLIPIGGEDMVTAKSKTTFALLYLTFGLPFAAIALFLIFYIFLFRPFQVSGDSMLPTYKNKEYILAGVASAAFQSPKQGDTVVFHSPSDPEKDLIKRVIAVPGDKIYLKDDFVYVNNNRIDESSYLSPGTKTTEGSFMKEGILIDVPIDNYIVMGDNRPFSSDSREWGYLAKDKVIGKIEFCYWNCPTK